MSKALDGLLKLLKTIFTSGKANMKDEFKIEASIDIVFEPKFKNEVLELKRPVDIKFPISSPFGWRDNPFKKDEKKFHNGIDFATPIGTPVYAMVDGECFQAGWENQLDQKQGFGLRVWQEATIEDKRVYIWYAHLSEVKIKPVEQIKIGDLIGYTGNSGSSTGPHLHVQSRGKNSGKLFNMVFHA